MPIRNSITEAIKQADEPSTIRAVSAAMQEENYEQAVVFLLSCFVIIPRMQRMADTGNRQAQNVMKLYRWRRFGVHPSTGEELGPQKGPLP